STAERALAPRDVPGGEPLGPESGELRAVVRRGSRVAQEVGELKALELAAELGHEEVVLIHDRESGLRGAIAIHDLTFGPGVGGTRMRVYPTYEAGVVDALRLARAMTY